MLIAAIKTKIEMPILRVKSRSKTIGGNGTNIMTKTSNTKMGTAALAEDPVKR
jgi:hypothetical protein